MDSATRVYLPDTQLPTAATSADYIAAAVATTKRPNAALRTIETALASCTVLSPKLLVRAQISVDITTSSFADVTTIRLRVPISVRTASATGTETQICPTTVVRLSEEITHTEWMNLDKTVMRAIFSNCPAVAIG